MKEIFNSIAIAAQEIKDLGHMLGLEITFSTVATHEKEPKEDNLIVMPGIKKD